VPEIVFAMLACAKIGAIHSVVFGGFSAEALAERINDSQCVLLITADGGYRRGSLLPLKQIADEALKHTPSIKNVLIVKRDSSDRFPVHVQEGRDHWYHRIVQDVETAYSVGETLANDGQWPNWNAGNPFKAARDKMRPAAAK